MLKVLTGLCDSYVSLMGFFCLYSSALTRMSLRDFPLRYDMSGGSGLRFLLVVVDWV